MRQLKKILALLLTTGMIAGSLAACGSKESTETQPAAETTAEETEQADEATAEVDNDGYLVWNLGSEPKTLDPNLYNDAADPYDHHPDVRVPDLSHRGRRGAGRGGKLGNVGRLYDIHLPSEKGCEVVRRFPADSQRFLLHLDADLQSGERGAHVHHHG